MENNINTNQVPVSPVVTSVVPPIINNQKPGLSPKEFFLSAGVLFSFVAFLVAFFNILFAIIDKIYPDPLLTSRTYGNYAASTISSLSTPLSTVIVFFPVLCILIVLTNRFYNKNLDKINSEFRKVIMYLVLFISSITIIVDLIMIIRLYLNGELGSRFLIKALSTIVIAILSAIYFRAVTKNTNSNTTKSINAVFIALFLAIVILPFAVFGSPANARKAAIDNQVSNNLFNLDNNINNYYQNTRKLPENKNEIMNVGFVDLSQGNITYTKKSEKTFSLCADFLAENKESFNSSYSYPKMTIGLNNANYNIHGVGNVCFDRQVQ